MKTDKVALLRDTNISEALYKLGIPTMIGMLVNALYNVVDAYFVGMLGTSQVGAIVVTFPINQVVAGVGMTFGTGAASYISRLLGEKNYHRANVTASTAVFGGLIFQAILITVSIVFIEQILLFLGATETIVTYAKEYAFIYISGTLISVFYVAMNNIVTAEGAAKQTMTAMLAGAGLNMIFDPIFIFVFNLGVSGAAWATVLSQLATATMYIIYLLKKKGRIRISIRFVTFKKDVLGEIFKVGIPILFYQLLFSVSQGMTNSAASKFGDPAVAAVGIVIRILSIGTFVVYGFAKGYQPLAGYAYGAKDFPRLKSVTKLALKWTSCFCAAFAITVAIFAQNIMKWFSLDVTVVSIGMNMLMANSVTFVLFGFQIVCSTLFLALGKVREGGILSISRNGLFFIPTILILPGIIAINGVICSQVIADFFSIILTILLLVRLIRELKKEESCAATQNAA